MDLEATRKERTEVICSWFPQYYNADLEKEIEKENESSNLSQETVTVTAQKTILEQEPPRQFKYSK
ncbi:hypothetical protein DFA_09125 [Cavenderia fasciculata]|uniref:Uncharacterized protein n=1 Tax=Cavenderia fasciculata TaxID=261658 RepID=F4Q6R8_CACFS|nr:uncharacterized protein DFA_09125 [Cavenderia fasciculata]EGG16578.1 hypothetical protein DFA_09125 [Cavenderia fasciculata]|eukprot:XP_004354978.1 hypothetical protein DFA_09125 [Cavenderia fasciculata]